MTRINERRCDVCDDRINDSRHVRIKRALTRPVKMRLYRWGIVDMAPVASDWVPVRVDVCGDCWDDVLEEVSDRV